VKDPLALVNGVGELIDEAFSDECRHDSAECRSLDVEGVSHVALHCRPVECQLVEHVPLSGPEVVRA